MSTKDTLLQQIASRTAVLARVKQADAMAVTPSDEAVIMPWLKQYTQRALFSANIASIRKCELSSISGTTVVIVAAGAEEDSLVGKYVTVLNESRKITANTASSDEEYEITLTIDDAFDNNPADYVNSCSICEFPEQATTAMLSDLFVLLPIELEQSVIAGVLSEWFSMCGEEAQSQILRQKSEIDLQNYRLTREKKIVTRPYRPI